MLIGISLIALAAALLLLALGVDPVPVWFYVFAWYPTLLLLDALAQRADGRPLAIVNRKAMLSAWLWSAPIWLFFEFANFRLQNWYYVFVPPGVVFRWTGILLSFATVLPAVLLAERLLEARGVGATWNAGPVQVTRGGLLSAIALGITQVALAFAWPTAFFPLIWGGMLLICEPYVYRKRPDLSLFADVEKGYWGRIGRLLIGGAGIGVLWETFNFGSRAKWIYTVPGLEGLKIWEMPVLGFVGFPFFALEAWAMYHALCGAGIAIPLGERTVRSRGRTAVAALITLLVVHQVMVGIDHYTISSVNPVLGDLPGVSAADVTALEAAGIHSVFQVPRTDRAALAARLSWPGARVDSLVRNARLAGLKGIGARHAYWLGVVGVPSVCELAHSDPEYVWLQLQPITRENDLRPSQAEVRVWQQAAARACVRG
ncbi:MAG: DUF4332 domain-containing protein [Gemmatimonadetes bacterium]|nr:DUF4332 domain-containing protein [Gemmatimonadota bacterium]